MKVDFPITSVSEFDALSQKVKWQYFEKLVAWIFEKNGFEARQNVVLVKDRTKRQFDVIASRYGVTYIVECKKWRGKSRVAGLRQASQKHRERCEFFGNCLPLLVVLTDDNVMFIDDIPVVPISKLNSFLNEVC